MLTGEGAVHIKRYLAGFTPFIAQSIAFGIGNKPESALDYKLQFEAGRADIALTSFDFINSRLVFKAELPETFAGQINEAAIFSAPANDVAGEFGSQIIVSFDSASEEWMDATSGAESSYASGTTSRIGENSLRQAPAASTTKTDVLNQLSLNLSGYSGNDKFVFAYNVGNGNTSGMNFRFMTDSANYYNISLGAQTAGYKIVEVNRSAATATGAPDWERVNELRVLTTSSAAGPSVVDFDGIRIEDTDTINPNYVMISREVLSTPFFKEEGMIQEVEFALQVNI